MNKAIADFHAYYPIYLAKLQAWRNGQLSYRGLQLHLRTMREIEADIAAGRGA